jgi:hypothetical protein
MIGVVPPAAMSDWGYVAVSILAGMITFFWYPTIHRLRSPELLFYSVGLGLFAVAGADKALAFHAGPFAAILFGTLTGIGGGTARRSCGERFCPLSEKSESLGCQSGLWPLIRRHRVRCIGSERFEQPT